MIKYFIEGPIGSDELSARIKSLNQNPEIGGIGMFMGQVRSDQKEHNRVHAIEYTCYPEMAIPLMDKLLEEIQGKYNLLHADILHSLGAVQSGAICLLVLTAAKHRKQALDACDELLERLKKEWPVWGKELHENASGTWKINN